MTYTLGSSFHRKPEGLGQKFQKSCPFSFNKKSNIYFFFIFTICLFSSDKQEKFPTNFLLPKVYKDFKKLCMNKTDGYSSQENKALQFV